MDGRNIPSEYGWFAKICFSNIRWFPSQEQPFQTWTALSLGGVLAVVFTMFLIIQKRPSTMDALYNGLASGKIRENLNRKLWFLPSNIVVSCKFSHHPVLWPLQFGSFLGSLFDSTVADPWEIGLQYPEKKWRLTRDIDRSPIFLVSMQLSEYLSNVGSAQVYFSFQVWQFWDPFDLHLPFYWMIVSFRQWYPLVNIQKTMENHHSSWENSL